MLVLGVVADSKLERGSGLVISNTGLVGFAGFAPDYRMWRGEDLCCSSLASVPAGGLLFRGRCKLGGSRLTTGLNFIPKPEPPPLLDDVPLCAGCGRCCHLVVELRLGDDVPEAYVAKREGTRFLDQRGDGACVALDPDTMLCTIYDTRPQTCRDFNRGEALCRRTLGLPAATPG